MTLFELLAPIAIIALISIPLIPVFQKKVSKHSATRRVYTQIALFGAVFLGVLVFSISASAETPAVDNAFVGSVAHGMAYLSAALAVSASALGAGYAVAQAAPAAIGAISEKEENFGKAMIFVALAEGVAIYGLLIAILIINKL